MYTSVVVVHVCYFLYYFALPGCQSLSPLPAFTPSFNSFFPYPPSLSPSCQWWKKLYIRSSLPVFLLLIFSFDDIFCKDVGGTRSSSSSIDLLVLAQLPFPSFVLRGMGFLSNIICIWDEDVFYNINLEMDESFVHACFADMESFEFASCYPEDVLLLFVVSISILS